MKADQEAVLKRKLRELLLNQQYMNQEANAMEQKLFQDLQNGQQAFQERIQNNVKYS